MSLLALGLALMVVLVAALVAVVMVEETGMVEEVRESLLPRNKPFRAWPLTPLLEEMKPAGFVSLWMAWVTPETSMMDTPVTLRQVAPDSPR